MFNQHPDMQPSLFEDILSCGSWIKDVLDSNANCRKVIIVGTSANGLIFMLSLRKLRLGK